MASTPEWAKPFVADARVGRLATANADAEPHVVPCVFVLLNDVIYSVIDEKPKSGHRLLRLRNIDATGKAALVVDRYDDDWSKLAFVLIRGDARAIGPDDPAHGQALSALRKKYPQYRDMDLDEAEMVALSADRWVAWRA